LKKSFLLRIDEEIFDKVKDISEVEERSINYMLCKLINKGLNRISLDESIEKDIEDFANKSRMSKSELIESIWKAYKKTYK
jgi:DNA helicase HerA-like ATPase